MPVEFDESEKAAAVEAVDRVARAVGESGRHVVRERRQGVLDGRPVGRIDILARIDVIRALVLLGERLGEVLRAPVRTRPFRGPAGGASPSRV